MQGYQFAHMETWSRKGVAKQHGQDTTVRRNGQRGWTAEQIMDEAAREPGASEHVGRDRCEPVVIAGTCESFDELRDAHAEACRAKKISDYTSSKTGKKGTRKKAVRVDTHTLYTSVISLPVETADALADKAVMSECRRAFDHAIAYEKRRLQDAGGELAMAAIHLDERHVHLHIFGLDRQRGSVNGLHPGKAALDAFRARHGALSVKGSDLFQRSKRTYCDAMRDWQDDLHREALGKVGLCRFGPRRARATRGQWVQRKREEEARAEAQQTIENMAAIRATQRVAAEAVAAREDNVMDMQDRLVAEQEELRQERVAVAEKEDRLEAGIAMIEALSEGLIAVESRGGKELVTVTPEAHDDDPHWRDLHDRLMRAPKEVTRLARRLSQPLRLLRQAAAEKGRADAFAAARAELAARFPRLGAIHAYARHLVTRLATPQEREEAAAALERTARGEANDTARFESETKRPSRGIVAGDD